MTAEVATHIPSFIVENVRVLEGPPSSSFSDFQRFFPIRPLSSSLFSYSFESPDDVPAQTMCLNPISSVWPSLMVYGLVVDLGGGNPEPNIGISTPARPVKLENSLQFCSHLRTAWTSDVALRDAPAVSPSKQFMGPV